LNAWDRKLHHFAPAEHTDLGILVLKKCTAIHENVIPPPKNQAAICIMFLPRRCGAGGHQTGKFPVAGFRPVSCDEAGPLSTIGNKGRDAGQYLRWCGQLEFRLKSMKSIKTAHLVSLTRPNDRRQSAIFSNIFANPISCNYFSLHKNGASVIKYFTS